MLCHVWHIYESTVLIRRHRRQNTALLQQKEKFFSKTDLRPLDSKVSVSDAKILSLITKIEKGSAKHKFQCYQIQNILRYKFCVYPQ